MNKTIKTSILAFSLLLPLSAFPAERENLPEGLRETAKKAIDLSYAGKFDESEALLKELIEKYPEHPFGYSSVAMVKWEREYLEGESDHSARAEEYFDLIEKSLDVGKKWLKKHPNDTNAHLCMGGMYGLKGMLYITQHKWLKAYFSGKKGIKSLKKALEIDPEVYDAYMGIGLYEYSAATLPSSIKWLSKFIMPGDAGKGIEYLVLCKEQGYFNSVAAKLFLIEIFTTQKSAYANPGSAVEWAKELFASYPDCSQMHFVYITALHFAGNYDEAEKEIYAYLGKIELEIPGYEKKYLPKALTSLGTVKMAKGEYSEALEIFEKARETLENEGEKSRWAVWGLVRMGNIYDILQKREKAVEFYKEAASYKESAGFKPYVDAYLKNPFHVNLLPDPLPPPPWIIAV